MNNKMIEIAEACAVIIEASKDLPSQYNQKIEELCSTILSVTAMAEGTNVITIDTAELGEGRHVINGTTVIIENGEIRLG